MHGFKKIGKCVEQNILLANILKDKFDIEPIWEILNPICLSVVCLRFSPENISDSTEIDELQGKIIKEIEISGRAFLTPVIINNKTGIRICFANHRTTIEDVNILFDTLTSIAKKLL